MIVMTREKVRLIEAALAVYENNQRKIAKAGDPNGFGTQLATKEANRAADLRREIAAMREPT
jgi:hypothetical protein